MVARRMALVFDLDGTLVDSVYQHVVAWHDALLASGIELSIWRIHRRIGMGGGLFTRALLRETGREFDPELLERLPRRMPRPTTAGRRGAAAAGGAALLARLTAVGCPGGIATSGRMETAAPVLAKLGVPEAVPIITRDMVAHAKPDPDLFLAALTGSGVDPGERLRRGRQRLGPARGTTRRHPRDRRAVGRLRDRGAGARRSLPGLRRSRRCCWRTSTSWGSARPERTSPAPGVGAPTPPSARPCRNPEGQAALPDGQPVRLTGRSASACAGRSG